jgi:hypothetical protein
MAVYDKRYLNKDEGLIPLANLFIQNRVILVVDIYKFKPVSTIHKVIFCYV